MVKKNNGEGIPDLSRLKPMPVQKFDDTQPNSAGTAPVETAPQSIEQIPLLSTDEQIKELRDTIKKYEDAIVAIERGQRFQVVLDRKALGLPYDSVDELQKKIEEAEAELRVLEKKELVPETVSQSTIEGNESLNLEERIQNTKTIKELLQIIASLNSIPDGTEQFSAGELITIIQAVQSGNLTFKYVTRTHGIRAAVIRLMTTPSSLSTQDIEQVTPPPLSLENLQLGSSENSIESEDAPEQILQTETETEFERVEDVYTQLQEARENYLEENHRYMSERKNVGLLGKLWKSLRGIEPEPESELPEELIEAKEEYDQAKIKLGKYMMSERRAYLESTNEEDIEEQLQKYKSTEVFDRVIIEEHLILESYRAESWEPSEKSIFMKGLKWYGSQSRLTKLSVGAVFAAGGAMVGGLSAPTVALFAGASMVRGALAMGAGLLAGKGFEKVVTDNSESDFEDSIEQLRKNYSEGRIGDKNTEKYFREFSEIRDSAKAKYNLTKNIIIAGAAMVTGVGLSQLESVLTTTPVRIESSAQTTPVETLTGQPLQQVDSLSLETTETGYGEYGLDEYQYDELEFETDVIVGGENDNMWNIIENQLKESDSGFEQLSKAAQSNAIDSIWQKVLKFDSEELEAMGITSGDPHILSDGQHIDMSSVMEQENIDTAMDSALNLTAEKLASISRHTSILERALAGYNGSIREELVNRIIKVAESKK